MDFNYLRRRSIFDPPAPTYPPFDFNQAATAQGQNITDNSSSSKLDTPAPRQPDEQSKFSSMYSDIANQQSGPANRKYQDFLSTNEPQRDNYKPTKMNRLSAILAGMSDGIEHGGGAGYKTAQGILDEPYNEARSQYDNQGKKLEASAGLEEKDMGRRVGILKDIITQERDQRNATELAKYHEGLLANGRDRNARTGLHYADITDPTTGNRTSNIVGPDGKLNSISLGKGGLSTTEAIDKAGKTAGAEASATEGSKKRVAAAGIAERGDQARLTQDHKFANLQEFLQAKQDNGWGSKYVGHRNKEGKLVMINNTDPTDIHVTGTDFDTMSDADKQKAKIELKAAPGAKKPDTTKVTDLKRDSNGKVIEATTKTTSGDTAEQTKPIPGNAAMEAFSTDGGKTWKARAKK